MNQLETTNYLFSRLSKSYLKETDSTFLDSLSDSIKTIKKDDKLTDNELREVFAEALA